MSDQTPQPTPAPSRVTRAMHWVAAAALVTMMLVVVGDVVLRAVFNTPVRGAYDLVSIALLVMVAFGTGPVIVKRSEITIDLIDHVVGPRGVRILGSIASVLTGVVIAFIGWSMIGPAQDAWQWGGYSLELGVPLWALWGVAFVGIGGIAWAAVVQVLGYIRDSEDQP